jgi:hypothetical protein
MGVTRQRDYRHLVKNVLYRPRFTGGTSNLLAGSFSVQIPLASEPVGGIESYRAVTWITAVCAPPASSEVDDVSAALTFPVGLRKLPTVIGITADSLRST